MILIVVLSVLEVVTFTLLSTLEKQGGIYDIIDFFYFIKIVEINDLILKLLGLNNFENFLVII